jgi:hypothetical protein
VVKGGEAEGGGRLAGGDRSVGVLQPLLQQWLELAHVLEGEVQGLESDDGIAFLTKELPSYRKYLKLHLY